MDAITLLEQQGIKVHYPMEQSCCRQPAFSIGILRRGVQCSQSPARFIHRKLLIIMLSGSCGSMMKHHWPKLFKGSEYEQRANELASRALSSPIFWWASATSLKTWASR
ncbi:hypothetical protein [Eikenella sp. NML96-A-049]|uniref:hypothetical protein n=1 Tax=unclassified Eikenella TaxID=2639367 RepID=UPI0035106530